MSLQPREKPINILDLSIEDYRSENTILFYTQPLWIKSMTNGYFTIDTHRRINPDMRKTIEKLKEFDYFRDDELKFPIADWGYYANDVIISKNFKRIIELIEYEKPLLAKFSLVKRRFISKIDVLSYKLSWDEFDVNPNEAFNALRMHNSFGLLGIDEIDIGPVKINKSLQNPDFDPTEFWEPMVFSEERKKWYTWRRNNMGPLRDELYSYFTSLILY